ncbi:DMT family transporter [Saccharibacillus kuerlensis]|uniref:Multidrug resistance protein YkkC n=1 Tax=Saccharibacillus kuerlensis TaxID=459527 RepID=A0ABQ2KXD0_9BACL|nr:multidrug efflux SMR transporter [Saccharibacillus kuerlensis]GGN93450.1 multidrug resistance protein YkkC [Saccharibacillus kuerlensis]
MSRANRGWIYVLIGGVFEVAWVSGLKHSSNIWEWLLTLAGIALSFWLMINAAKILPIGSVYAVFTGLGTAGTVIAETVLFGEPFSLIKTLLILLLLSGVVGLKLITDAPSEQNSASTPAGLDGKGGI